MESQELPPTDNKNTLTPEQETRCNRDIRTIAAITDVITDQTIPQDQRMVAVLTAGYAVEAYCGGKMTRPHEDVDMTVFSPMAPDNSKVAEQVGIVLEKEETYTRWQTLPGDPQQWQAAVQTGKIKFIEGQKDLIPYSAKRRLEMRVYQTDNPSLKYVQRKLIDSEGIEYSVNVIRLSNLVAEKVQKMHELRQTSHTDMNKSGRQTRPSDFTDIKRLISLPEFDEKEKQTTLEIITRRMNRDLPPGSPPIDPNVVFNSITAAL